VLQVRLVVVVLPTFESCPFKAKRHELAVEDMNEDHGVVEKQTCETFLLHTITIVQTVYALESAGKLVKGLER
jgi:hypothetical protein